MPTPYAELTVDQGTTFETSIDLVGDDGAAINIAGYSFSAQIRKSYYSSNVTANLTINTVNVAGGNIILSMNSATTTNIRAGRYLYDVKMTDTANVVTRVVEGVLTVTPQVSR
jgi:hypothetical protein